MSAIIIIEVKCPICGLKYKGSIAMCPNCVKRKSGEDYVEYHSRQLSEAIGKIVCRRR